MLGWQIVFFGGLAAVGYGIYLLFKDSPWFMATFIGVCMIGFSLWAKEKFE